MNSAVYIVLALLWLTYGLTLGNNDFFASSSQSDNEWDPSRDFFGEYSSDKKDSSGYDRDDSQAERKDRVKKLHNKEDLLYRAYLTRYINIFLTSAGFLDGAFEDDIKTIRVDLTLSKEDFAILKKFGSDDNISLSALEHIFRSMFNSKHEFNAETPDFMNYLNYTIFLALLLAIVAHIVAVIMKINFKISGIRIILFIVYISIVSHELFKQYEDVSENLMIRRMEFDNLGEPPVECLYSKMNVLRKIYVHLFKDDMCQRYRLSRKSVWYEMDLASALIKPFQSIYSTLCTMLGEGSEKMITPFIDRSPWPINIVLEFLLTIMQLPLLFFGLFLIFFAFTSRNISLKIPFILSMAAEKRHEMNYHSSEKSKEENKLSSGGSIKNYVINKGGIVLLGNEDKQFQSYSIQGSSSLNFNSQPLPFETLEQNNGPFLNRETGCLEDTKSGNIVNKQLAINKKEVRREHKKLTYSKKMNFKPNKRNVTLKIAKETLDILPEAQMF
ncbi:uncharacterized protein [Halyomorpha halys]|uniref:uncharacterized protein n=1 Tax=Halyomorpha halys TaxID=286706 RepID=UPI0034D1AAC9